MARLLVSAGAVALGCAAASGAAWAQAGAVSQPVVQALPNRNSLTLNQALARLGQNPRDIDALIDAGNAALAMGDVDASVGFFRRADQISPGNGRVKAGLAGALVHSENPYDAIPMFEEAQRDGAAEGVLGGERGLAYDLVGDNEKAQRFYKAALAREMDDEIIRRLALSYAIGGDKRSSELIITPLLQKQDKAAWRTRAFSLAILGQVDEAVSIANSTLPASLAAGISPYLRYMPRLTPAQQAAAANLGHFPRASEIGRDDPRVAQYAPKTPRKPAQVATADAALTPRGQPLGRNDKAQAGKRDRANTTALAANTATRPQPATNATSWRNDTAQPSTPRRTSTQTQTAPAQVAQARTQPAQTAAARTTELPPLHPATTRPATSALTTSQAAPPRTAAASPLPTRPAVAPPALAPSRTTTSVAGPSLSVSSPAVQGLPAPVERQPAPAQATPALAANTPPAAATPAPVAQAPMATAAPTPTPTPPPVKVNLADAFADFLKPTIDVAPAAGAVDVRRLAPSREETETKPTQGTAAAKNGKAAAAKPAKPPAPSHPSRIWVQVATGRDKAALAFDWRRMNREKAQVFRGKSAFISAWGQTNRLLTGPFPTEAAANAFIAQLRRADVDGSFLWTSPAGQVVDPIATK